MSYSTGAIIPDADDALTTDFIPVKGRTCVWVNFPSTNMAFHLTHEQITKLRDDLSRHLKSQVKVAA